MHRQKVNMKVKVVYAKCKQGLTLCCSSVTLCAAAQCQGLWGLRGWEVRLSLGGACPELSRKEENSGQEELSDICGEKTRKPYPEQRQEKSGQAIKIKKKKKKNSIC